MDKPRWTIFHDNAGTSKIEGPETEGSIDVVPVLELVELRRRLSQAEMALQYIKTRSNQPESPSWTDFGIAQERGRQLSYIFSHAKEYFDKWQK